MRNTKSNHFPRGVMLHHDSRVIWPSAWGRRFFTSEFAEDFPAGFETRIYQSSQYVINMTLGGIPLHWPDGYASFNFAGSVLGSGFAAHEFAAQRALLLSRLPELPVQYPNSTLGVHMRFEYQR